MVNPSLSAAGSPILLFDGVCNLCNGAVRFLIKHDKQEALRYGSLQSAKALELCRERNIAIAQPLQSMILIAGPKALTKSDAWLELFRILGGAWKLMLIFKIFPAGFRDFFYDWIARNRYKWFGSKSSCPLPSPEQKHLFVD